MLWKLQKWASCSFCFYGTCSLVGIKLYDEVVQKCLFLVWEGVNWGQGDIGCEVYVPDGHQCKCWRSSIDARNGTEEK